MEYDFYQGAYTGKEVDDRLGKAAVIIDWDNSTCGEIIDTAYEATQKGAPVLLYANDYYFPLSNIVGYIPPGASGTRSALFCGVRGDAVYNYSADEDPFLANDKNVHYQSVNNSLIAIKQNGTSVATQAISAGQYVIWNGNLYTADSNIASGATLASYGGSKNLTAVSGGGLNDLKSFFNEATKVTTYSAAVNGVTWRLSVAGNGIGVLSIYTGSLTNNVATSGVLVSLSDFSADLSGKKFQSSFQFVSTTDATKRIACDGGGTIVQTASALQSGFSPRGCCSVILV